MGSMFVFTIEFVLFLVLDGESYPPLLSIDLTGKFTTTIVGCHTPAQPYQFCRFFGLVMFFFGVSESSSVLHRQVDGVNKLLIRIVDMIVIDK
ncbi:hypothetical protein BC941DRAFT_444505 [Chlamydoabsidia padenii]|nr:hypothetical protein BC941DRAFT_444505 [Chlamydoabsidia padenii]